MIEVLWSAVHGLYAPIAMSMPITLFVVAIFKTVIRTRGEDTIENKVKSTVDMSLDILYTMSANLAGGALLAKMLESKIKCSDKWKDCFSIVCYSNMNKFPNGTKE